MSRTVINVESRENSPSRARAPATRARAKRPVPAGEVIELTDSEPEEARAGPSRLRNNRKVEPVARPSRVRAVKPVVAHPRQQRAPHREPQQQLQAQPQPQPPPEPQPQPRPRPPQLDYPAGAAEVPQPLPLFLPDMDDGFAELPALQPLPAALPAQAAVAPDPPQVAQQPEVVVVPDDDDIPFDAYVAQVLEIIPDVLPAHVFSLIEKLPAHSKGNVVESVLHLLFENPDYPKADMKGKRKREEPEPEPSRVVKQKVDYGDKHRKSERSMYYTPLALDELESEFLDIPTAHIRQMFKDCNALYAPTYLLLREQQSAAVPPYKKMLRPRNKGKGKRVQRQDEELEKEKRWVQEKLQEEEARRAAEMEEETKVQEEGGIECGCCFSEYPFDKMVQCPEAHLFCTTCMMSYAETKLGEHDARIVCMDQSGCKLAFPESELRRFLSPKLLELYERVKQRKEIEAAGLEGLEECPFCEYKVVIENEQERLFRCENEACGAVTCRQCKKLDHLPKSCQEVEDDKKLDARHAVEEAMTRALMRNCPKCKKGFVKESGCNKMTCPNCGTMSCYICRKVITGYDHFNNPPPYTGIPDPKKCPLWDASVDVRHNDEVIAAAKEALERYKREHPEVDEKDIAVDLPPAPAPAPGPSRAVHPHGQGHGRAHAPAAHPPPLPPLGRQHALAHHVGVAGPAHGAVVDNWRDEVAAAMGRVHQREREDRLREQLLLAERQRQAAAAGPVFNVQVHINHQPAQAGPAYMPAPVPVPAPAPAVAAPRAVRAPPRRSARKRR